jgi:cell division protein FtsW (lipid II flippase)
MNATVTKRKRGPGEYITSVRAAMNDEVARRVRADHRRTAVRVLLALGLFVVVVAAVADPSLAAADPVNHGTNKFMQWGAGIFGVFCVFKVVHALSDEKFTKFFAFAGAALLATPFVFAPDTVEKVGKQLTQTIFGV